MYYIIEKNYVGPNQRDSQYIDIDTIEISTIPAFTNSSHTERTDGWCGTTNDWAIYAHGKYPTIAAARAAIMDTFVLVRDCDADGVSFTSDDESVVAVYKLRRFEPMSSQATVDWAWGGIESDIHADTTDERIYDLISEYETEANRQGFTLDKCELESVMWEQRGRLRD